MLNFKFKQYFPVRFNRTASISLSEFKYQAQVKPISLVILEFYFQKKMSNSQQNITIAEKELEAMVTHINSVKHLHGSIETPKKTTNATNLNLSKSHALFRSRNNSETESSTVIEEGLSGSTKRKCHERQGPSNIGPKSRKVIVAATKNNKKRDSRSDTEAIEYYKNLVIEESLIKLEQQQQINRQLIQIGKITQVLHNIGGHCSAGLNECENIKQQPRPMAISLSRCHNDPTLANIHNSYVNRMSQNDQKNKKINTLMKTMGTIIQDCSSGLQIVSPTLVRSSTRSQTKKIHISHPPQKKFVNEKDNIETTVEIKTEVQTQTHVEYANIEIDLPDNLSSDDKETWEHMKRRHRFAASEKARLENDLFKFKDRLAEKRSEDIDFATFNISQENIENQNKKGKPPNNSFRKFLGVNLSTTTIENPTGSQSDNSDQNQLPTSMKVETGCSNSAESE